MAKSIMDFWKEAAAEITDTSKILDTTAILDKSAVLEINSNNGKPIIFFVNGHFSKFVPGPAYGGKKYWDYFDPSIPKNSAIYFGIKKNFHQQYVNGSSLISIDSSGQERFEKGYEFAKNNFISFKNILINNSVYFVCHSEGCAFAAGIAKYFFEKKINIGEIIFLSCDEGDEFEIDFNVNAYQVEYMYYDKSIPDGNCEPEFDWIINTNKNSGGVKGINKFGIIIEKVEYDTVHGSTANSEIFKSIEDLKEVKIINNLNKKGRSFNSQTIVTNNTKFYLVDKQIIDTNNPQWNKNILEVDYTMPCK